jgi:AcrR family transcriptional regulator
MSRPRVRPTRDETKQRLTEAAARVFTRQGIGAASVEDITDEAGFSRGAFYSNFTSKEELVISMLRDHHDQTRQLVDRIVGEVADPVEMMHAATTLQTQRRSPIEGVLYMEFMLYALRDPANRPMLAESRTLMRTTIAHAVVEHARRSGRNLPRPPEDVADVIMALDLGFSMHGLLDPSQETGDKLWHALSWLSDLV